MTLNKTTNVFGTEKNMAFERDLVIWCDLRRSQAQKAFQEGVDAYLLSKDVIVIAEHGLTSVATFSEANGTFDLYFSEVSGSLSDALLKAIQTAGEEAGKRLHAAVGAGPLVLCGLSEFYPATALPNDRYGAYISHRGVHLVLRNPIDALYSFASVSWTAWWRNGGSEQQVVLVKLSEDEASI